MGYNRRGIIVYIHCKKKTQNRKFETNIPIKGIARPQSQFPHSCVCERFVYSHYRSAYSAAEKYVDRSWEYNNRSQPHECGNWDLGRTVPFLGIHKWDFRCSTRVSVPSSILGSPFPSSPTSECVSPLGPKGGEEQHCLRGWGNSIRTTGKKAWHSVYSV
jgi:hypothetical protein